MRTHSNAHAMARRRGATRTRARGGEPGLSKPAIKRLARRGGVRRISGLTYDETRKALRDVMAKIIRDAATYAEHARRLTVIPMDIVRALKRNNRTLYGFGGFEPPQTTESRTRRAKKIESATINVTAVRAATAQTGSAAGVSPVGGGGAEVAAQPDAEAAAVAAAAPGANLVTPVRASRGSDLPADETPVRADPTAEDVGIVKLAFSRYFQELDVEDGPVTDLFTRARDMLREKRRPEMSEAGLRNILEQLDKENRVMVVPDTGRVHLL